MGEVSFVKSATLELKENAEHYQVLSYVDKELVKLPPFQHIDLNLAHVFA